MQIYEQAHDILVHITLESIIMSSQNQANVLAKPGKRPCKTRQTRCHSMSTISPLAACADPESFVRGGPTQTTFFGLFLMMGERIQIALKVDHHRPAIKVPFKWCFAGGSMVAQYFRLAW